MKAFLIAAAMAVGIAATGPAAAQMGGNMHSTSTHTTTVRQTTTDRHNSGWHGPRWTKKKVCRTVWRNHHRVRSCTWQRVRVR